MLNNLKEFNCEQIEWLGEVYGVVEFKYRDKHSFTKAVLECHFEDGERALTLSGLKTLGFYRQSRLRFR